MHSNLFAQYRNAMQHLGSSNGVTATQEALQALCPHLGSSEVNMVLRKAHRAKQTYRMAVPALRVQDSVLIIGITPRHRDSESRCWVTSQIVFDGVRRTGESAVPPAEVAIYPSSKRLPWTRRALEFAQKHWGGRLVRETWKSALQITLEDPGDLSRSGLPARVATVTCVLSVKHQTINRSKTLRKTIDAAILHITDDAVEAAELVGYRASRYETNCARCGGALGVKSCPSCRITFCEMSWRMGGWKTSLPEKVTNYLTMQGMVFAGARRR